MHGLTIWCSVHSSVHDLNYMVAYPIGCDKPEIGDLVHHVAPNLNKDWSYLGYELLEAKNSNIIQQIEGNIKGDVTECANKLFERWLKLGYPNTTWNRIIAALEKINLNALAQDISSKLLPAAGSYYKIISKNKTECAIAICIAIATGCTKNKFMF